MIDLIGGCLVCVSQPFSHSGSKSVSVQINVRLNVKDTGVTHMFDLARAIAWSHGKHDLQDLVKHIRFPKHNNMLVIGQGTSTSHHKS